MIAFVGSVFSPYYRFAFRRGRADAYEHCALNVALYSKGASRWTMTERGARHVRRSAQRLDIGPSAVSWDGESLRIDIDEIANPLPRRVRGTVRVRPLALSRFVTRLDDAGRHRWGPIAPCARVEVELGSPALRWQGHAYLDSNEGDEPVTAAFRSWDWMRATLADGSTAVVYDVRQRHAGERLVAERFTPDGQTMPLDAGARCALPRTAWGMARSARGQVPPSGPSSARVLRTLEDTPFYARSVVHTRLAGEDVAAMHETLSVDRFASPLVQAMLPWRMPRRG